MTSDIIADRPATAHRPAASRVIIATSIGNMLEWFDFLIYGYFALTLAAVFFPVGNGTAALMVTFGTFGLSL